jgi:hypothetical protein
MTMVLEKQDSAISLSMDGENGKGLDGFQSDVDVLKSPTGSSFSDDMIKQEHYDNDDVFQNRSISASEYFPEGRHFKDSYPDGIHFKDYMPQSPSRHYKEMPTSPNGHGVHSDNVFDEDTHVPAHKQICCSLCR